MPGPETKPLFDEARRLGVGFCLGYAELTSEGAVNNVYLLVDGSGSIVGKFHKVHIPGHGDYQPDRPFQHLERYYFDEGEEGFGVWPAFDGLVGMAVCNDRRWPETYREMGLQGVEMILIGYNTPLYYAPDPTQNALASFHNHLVMQAGAYQNGTWVSRSGKGRNRRGGRVAGAVGDLRAVGSDRGPGGDDRRRADRRSLRSRHVPELQGDLVQLRPVPPAGGLRPNHGPKGRGLVWRLKRAVGADVSMVVQAAMP